MSKPALFSPPHPRAVHRAIELPVALVGALLAHPVLLGVSEAVAHADRPRGGWAAVAACTALISVVHFRLSAGGKTLRAVLMRSVALGLLLGPLASGISLASVIALTSGAEPGVLGAFVLGTVFGSVVGGGIGLAFGLGYAPLAMAASHHRAHPTHAGAEKARAVAGALVVVASAAHHGLIGGDVAFQAAAAVFGLIQIALAAWRLGSLEIFLHAVRRGKKPRWSLATPRDPSDAAGLVPVHGRAASEMVLYRETTAEGAHPYRAPAQWLPVARIAA